MKAMQTRFPDVPGIQYVASLLFCLAPLFTSAQPANDDFTNRTKIIGSVYSAHIDNTLATAEAGESNNFAFFTPPNHSLWWTWTAPKDEVICISTRGSAVNTEMAVYTGDALDALTPIAFCTYYSISEVVFPAHKGTNYQITADSYWYGSTGKIELSLFPALVPRNDYFSNRMVLKGMSASVTGCSRFASIEPGESYPAPIDPGGSVWYSWTAPKTGIVSYTFSEKHWDPRRGEEFWVFTGDSLTNLAPQLISGGLIKSSPTFYEDGGNFAVTQGVTYQISVLTAIADHAMMPADSQFHLSFKLTGQ